MNLDIKKIGTEQRNEKTVLIDQVSTLEMVRLINEEDKTVAYAVEKALPQIASCIDALLVALHQEGRMIYVGAGTSGRLGLIDAVECRPTFSVPDEMVQCVMAGGLPAVVHAVEGAEDSKILAVEDLKKIDLQPQDFVIGITASGRTPYAVGGVEYAKKIGCKTGCIVTSPNSEIAHIVDYPIEAITGHEPLTGSTRMKSGTAQKMICNMLSTGVMIKLGKVYENWMIDVQATNEKLVKRAHHIISQVAGVSEEQAKIYYDRFHSVKKAIFSLLSKIEDAASVEHYLNEAKGHLRHALEEVNK